MDKTRTVSQKWLTNELVLSFWALKKCAKTKSNPIIPLKVVVLPDGDDRKIDTVVKSLCMKIW